MEEEDLSFQNPFFLQTANNTNPKQQKQPKPNTSKCNCNPSSSITQQKITHTKPTNIQIPGQILHHLMLKTLQLQPCPNRIILKKQKYRLTNPKKIVHIVL